MDRINCYKNLTKIWSKNISDRLLCMGCHSSNLPKGNFLIIKSFKLPDSIKTLNWQRLFHFLIPIAEGSNFLFICNQSNKPLKP